MQASTTQPELFTTCALCEGKTWHGRGRLVVTTIDDGRALIRLDSSAKESPWLELLPEDVAWLASVLLQAVVRCP